MTAKAPQKTFGSKTMKHLSLQMSSLKSISTSSTPEAPTLLRSLTELDSHCTNTSHLLHSKLNLTQNVLNSLTDSLKSQRSELAIQSSKLSKTVKLSKNRLSQELNSLVYAKTEMENKVLKMVDSQCADVKGEIGGMGKARKNNSQEVRQMFDEKFQRMKYVVDREKMERASKSEVILDQIQREFRGFDLELEKEKKTQTANQSLLWNEFESCQDQLDKEIALERQYRLKVQNKIFELFEEACKNAITKSK